MQAPKPIEFRSDTFCLPSEKMRDAMRNAEFGDDVSGEDPTMNRLQACAAELLGKEAALFVPSGTFGNQLAIYTHTQPSNEVILSENAHIIEHECGAAPVLSAVQLRCVPPTKAHYLTVEDIAPRVRYVKDIHLPKTALICVENALADGTVMPIEAMAEVKRFADAHQIPVHLDGARIFNAALALGVQARDIAQHATSVMFCISKGLGAPVGSLLCGPREYIERARWNRKRMGGGMRKVGGLAACGLLALTEGVQRLPLDHARAQALAEGLRSIHPTLVIDVPVQTCMVFVRVKDPTGKRTTDGFDKYLNAHGVRVYELDRPDAAVRFVVSLMVDDHDIERTIAVARGYFAE